VAEMFFSGFSVLKCKNTLALLGIILQFGIKFYASYVFIIKLYTSTVKNTQKDNRNQYSTQCRVS